jgi:hypothetical protein
MNALLHCERGSRRWPKCLLMVGATGVLVAGAKRGRARLFFKLPWGVVQRQDIRFWS